MAKSKFWNFKNSEEASELLIYGDISDQTWFGDEVTPKLFKQELDECKGDLDIFINSGGGDVFAGMTIFNMLKRYEGKKIVHIDGLAASIASVIAMAGDEIVMPENAMLMIHNAWTMCAGNRTDLRKMADELEKIDGIIAETYASRGGEKDYAKLMDEETWFTAKEALEAGLIDRVDEGKRIAASMDGDFLCADGVRIDTRRFENRAAVEAMVTEDEDHSNREEIQPVDDNKNKADEMLRRINDLRLKIAEERMNEE